MPWIFFPLAYPFHVVIICSYFFEHIWLGVCNSKHKFATENVSWLFVWVLLKFRFAVKRPIREVTLLVLSILPFSVWNLMKNIFPFYLKNITTLLYFYQCKSCQRKVFRIKAEKKLERWTWTEQEGIFIQNLLYFF